jgi:hypothetical protein
MSQEGELAVIGFEAPPSRLVSNLYYLHPPTV